MFWEQVGRGDMEERQGARTGERVCLRVHAAAYRRAPVRAVARRLVGRGQTFTRK